MLNTSLIRFITVTVCRNLSVRQICNGIRSQSTRDAPTKTIFALSSGHGKCGVAVVRISGPGARVVLKQVAKFRHLPQPRKGILRRLFHPDTGEMLDRGLVLWFPGPNSYTGEDCCELHVHGGPAVVAATLSALQVLPSFTHAEPGEYTKRAFHNGKLDLTEVEGLADLIHAETETQRQQAMRQLQGQLSQCYNSWKSVILKSLANSEAYIDFSEDENIEDGVIQEAFNSIKEVKEKIDSHLCDNRRGERLRNGVHAVIVGPPNVGKSSLLNVICQRPAAIVSPIAGTTRDVVETALNIGGYPLLLSDTAGLRDTQDMVEREGVNRALKRAQNADLLIVMFDATALQGLSRNHPITVTQLVTKHLGDLGLKNTSQPEQNVFASENNPSPEGTTNHPGNSVRQQDLMVVFNKLDLYRSRSVVGDLESRNEACCGISCVTEEGVDHFLQQLKEKVSRLCANPSAGSPSLTQERHRFHLTQCSSALSLYLQLYSEDIVLATHHLRKALRHLGKITGQVSSDEILDVVFRDFCIGK